MFLNKRFVCIQFDIKSTGTFNIHTCHGLDKLSKFNLFATSNEETDFTLASGTTHKTNTGTFGCSHLSSIIASNSALP